MKPNTKYRTLTTFTGPGDVVVDFERILETNSQGSVDLVHVGRHGMNQSVTMPKYVLSILIEGKFIEEVMPWKPEGGETFYKIFSDGSVGFMNMGLGQEITIEFGNYFKTREEAEKFRDEIAFNLKELKKASI